MGIASFLPLPELLPGVGVQNVVVRRASSKQAPQDGFEAPKRDNPAREAVNHWDGVGTFVIRDGKEVLINPAPDAQDSLVRSFLLGPVLAVLLRQRGFLVLHASAVAVDTHVILFMGGSGWGKSTLAAALCQNGYRLLSDDVTAIDMTAHHPTVIPGYPQVKLWPDSAKAIGQDPELLPRLYSGSEKRVCRTLPGFCHEPLPLARAYVLSEGSSLQITELEPQAALIELVRHSSRVRQLPSEVAPAHLQQCAKLVNSVPLSRLTVPRSFSLLSTVASILAEEALHPAA
jgi:hypothetical protein